MVSIIVVNFKALRSLILNSVVGLGEVRSFWALLHS